MVVDLVGQTLGQYRIDQLIGMGGMARVFKGYQMTLDRPVAIKAIPVQGEGAQERSFVQRFNAEARMVAKLTHANIVPIHDFGEERGWAFIVMEFIAGGTVREQLVQADQTRQLLRLPWVLNVLEQAARALDFAHRNGIVHRDVKPGNMLLRTEDQLLLSDFGIATILAASAAYSRSGQPVGTPQYMAPEQGTPHAPVDGRADIYGLGVVLYQCATNRLPFYAETPAALILKHINEPPVAPRTLIATIPPHVENIILRAMAKDPRQRFQHAAEMADELRAARAEMQAHARTAQTTMPAAAAATATVPSVMPLPAYPSPRSMPLGMPETPGICFRCGTHNSPQQRYCNLCGYDLTTMQARLANDRYLAQNGRPLRCRLVFLNGPLAGHAYTLHQELTTVGRTAGNGVIINDGTVSRLHARLYFQNGSWVLDDCNSSNGTGINGRAIKRPTLLAHGDRIAFGDIQVAFELVS